MSRRTKLTALMLALVVALAACGNPRPEVQSVAINEAIQLLLVGESFPLTTTVEAVRGADQSVIWSSSDDAIATVDAYGVVTGVARGTVVITATSAFNPRLSDSVEILIGPAPPSPTFTLALAPTAATVTAGSNSATVATITRSTALPAM